MSDWRSNDAIILEAELLASPPSLVAEHLHKRAETLDSIYDDKADERVELALVGRHEPIIDLALARWGMYEKALAGLFARGRPSEGESAIHIALLGNEAAARAAWWFPDSLVADRSDLTWIGRLSNAELHALFSNKSLPLGFLNGFLEQKQPWDALTDEQRRFAISSLSTKFATHGDCEDRWDGWSNYDHDRVYDRAWHLATVVPAVTEWAAVLGPIYRTLRTRAFSMNNPLDVAKRWMIDKEEEKAANSKDRLHDSQNVRAGLARLVAQKGHGDARALLNSDDLAIRCGAYMAMSMDAEAMGAAFENDGEIALDCMMDNEDIWRDPNARQALHDLCWKAPDEHSSMGMPRHFSAIEQRMMKVHPEWFKEMELREIDDSAPAVHHPESALLRSVKAAVDRQAILLWAVIAALVALVIRG